MIFLLSNLNANRFTTFVSVKRRLMKSFWMKHTVPLLWIKKRLSERQLLILSSMMIGLTAGMSAIILKMMVHFIHNTLLNNTFSASYLYLIFPLVGLLLTVFYVQRFHKGSLDSGTAFVLYSISRKSSLLEPIHTFAHVITSAITIGFGGSSGLEASIATTGAAIGSNYSRTYHLTYKQRTLLLSCGAAAGIAAVFDAPVAGFLFAIEVLLIDISASAFIPLIIAAAMGALCSNIVFQEGVLLSFKAQETFDFTNIPFYLMLAVLAGLLSVYHSRMFVKIDRLFERVKQPYIKAIVGGLILTCCIALFPPLFGEGYSSIAAISQLHPEALLNNSLLSSWKENEWLILIFLAGIALTKVIATAATLSGGGSGGNFAPSLMAGAFLGIFFSRLCNMTGFAKLPENNFTLVAMAGVMSGVMHAPLTAIFLIAEITGGYGLMIPLMIVAAISYSIVKFLEPDSIDTIKLSKKGHEVIHDRDKKILSFINANNIIETNFHPVHENSNLRMLISSIEQSTRNIFPVINDDDKLVGIIYLDSIREIMFNQDLYDTTQIRELMASPPAVIEANESMESIMKKFDETEAWNLPVVTNGKYAGFISKSRIFNQYRNRLIETSVH
jgi:CIC family chloride channel protein